MKFTRKSARTGTALCALFTLYATCGAATGDPQSSTIPVGWRDELNDINGWQPYQKGTAVDAFASRPGAMTMRLPHVPDGYPYTYQWGGLTHEATVDLSRYPVLVARVSRVQDGSYAHMEVSERDYYGETTRTFRTPTLQGRGVIVSDVGKEWSTTDTRRMTIRLIVGGALAGASAEYAWVRFVRREDVAKLQSDPDGVRATLVP